jgi:hypothetical protein
LPIANNNPVPQTNACCMIIPEEFEYRNKIPGDDVPRHHRESAIAADFKAFRLGKYDAVNFGTRLTIERTAPAGALAQTIL